MNAAMPAVSPEMTYTPVRYLRIGMPESLAAYDYVLRGLEQLNLAGDEHILGRQDPLREALQAAGFVVTPRGLRLRA